MKILCNVGKWNRTVFLIASKEFSPTANIILISSSRKEDGVGVFESYYANLSKIKTAIKVDEIDFEVIVRDRLLRLLQPDVASHHVRAMRQAIRALLIREKPDIILSETVDQFFHDILFQEAESLGISAYAPIQTFVNGYFRFSVRGEMSLVREPGSQEVEEVASKILAPTYRPEFLISSDKQQFISYIERWLTNQARVIYFFILRYLTGDPFNYRYWSSSISMRQYNCHALPRISLGDTEWRSKLTESGKIIIFIPLQYFPEATIDYWCTALDIIDYPIKLVQIIRKLSSNFHILIKEHPNVWGTRKPEFYKSIEQCGASVTIAPTQVPAQKCILASDSVLVWTGSVGFEAALRGKPVLTMCSPYYASGQRFKQISLKSDNNEIQDFIQKIGSTSISTEEQNEMVRYLLRGLLPGRFQNDGTFNVSDPNDVANAKKVGEWLRYVYERKRL